MRVAGIVFAFLFFPLFISKTWSQDTKVFDSLLVRADSFYKAKSYDSSLHYSLGAIRWLKGKELNNYLYIQSAWAMLYAGKSYRQKNDLENAQRFLFYSLQQSRINKMSVDIETAVVELNELHQYIIQNNLSFNYPAVAATEEMSMYFPVTKVEVVSADSIRITIRAGKYDGVTDTIKRGSLISKYNSSDKNRSFGLVNCYLREVDNNYTIAMATNDSVLKVFVGDFVELKTRVPVYWRNIDISRTASRMINFTNNYNEPIYSTRFLYYYADSLTNSDLIKIIKNQLEDVVNTLGKDTLAGDYGDVKGSKGVFAGENVMRAIARSNTEHIRLYLSFVNEYPRKYMGYTYKFADTYATWIINSTPLASADIAPFLINQPSSSERQRMASNLSEDIMKDDLISRWFNEGMLMANGDNIDSAQYMSQLIKDVTLSLKDKTNMGWASYLAGFTEKKLSNYRKADSLFKFSLQEFTTNGNDEGKNLAISAIANLKKIEKIKVSVQTGHLFPYIVAMSPNSRYMATGGVYDKFIKVWDLLLGKEILTYTAHDDEIYALQYSPNGRYLVSSSADSTIKIWNAYDYSLIRSFKRPKAETAVIFTPDSKQLVAGGKDSLVKFLDISTGKVNKTFKLHKAMVTALAMSPEYPQYLFSGGSDSMIYKWNLEDGEMDRWYREKGKVLGVWYSNNGRFMCTLSTDTTIHVWDVENKKSYYRTKVNASKSIELGTFAGPSFSPDSKLLSFAVSNDTLAVLHLATLNRVNYGVKNGNYSLFDVSFSQDGNYLAARYDMGGPMRFFNFSTYDFFNNSSIGTKDIKTYYTLPLSIQFTQNDDQLVIVHDGISKIDLKNGSTSFLYYGALSFQNNYVLLNKENIGIYTDTERPSLKFFDYVNKEWPDKVSLPDSSEILTQFELTANNRYVFLGGDKGTVAGFEMATRKKLFSNVYNNASLLGFAALRYDSIRQKIYAIEKGDRILVIDPKNGKLLDTIIANNPLTIEVSPKFLYVTCANSEVYKYDAITYKLVKKIKVHESGKDCYGSVMSGNYKYLVVQVADKFVTLDTKTDIVLYTKYDHDYENGMMTISHNNRFLATGGFDCKVNMYDLATGNVAAIIYTPRGKDFMIVDKNGNYLAPKNTLDAVTFNYNNSSYGFEQFDTRFNRPDLVLKTFGRADSTLLKSYYAAFKKRLKKLNITESSLSDDVHLPVVRLKDKFALKPTTSLSEYEITIESFDAKYPLKSLQVLVNSSPLFGTAGKELTGNKVTTKIKIPLSLGNNNIKVYCTNSKGAVSLAEMIDLSSSYTPAITAKTYFIGIAVSNYKDSSMNLHFAAKDVRDLATSFKKLWRNYEADTLIDEQVTKENILALRNKLMKTSVNDKVIISVNGHGMLSDSLDFYYGTYDINFKNPTKRGLKYEDLEALLDGIPARKKLLLIDACHSGALDKEEMLAQQKKQNLFTKDTTSEKGIVKGFTRGLIVKTTKAATDANSSYEVMQNLFADISAGNGAVVISAAGGMEYAFESEKWNNGVFTYCIRKGLEEEMADLDGGDGNKAIDVTELKNYVSKKVSELTKGKQRPVSRRENIEFNWVIW